MAVLRYGIRSSVQLDFADGALSGEYGTPPMPPLDDPLAAVTAALEAPLDFPPLGRITTPSDHVTLALDHGVPQAAQITAAVIHALVQTGIDPDGISVLRTRADVEAGAEDPCRLLPEEWRDRVTRVIHDPSERREMAYLAASEEGEPIFLNRLLTDADVVLPIGCLHHDATSDYYGIHGSIYPAFSDQKTLVRFHAETSRNGTKESHHRRLAAEADHVAWLLGISFTIQVVPAGGSAILHVLVGQSETVRRQAQQLYRAAWSWQAPQQASLVVAAIEGDAAEQTWENVGRALETAAALVEEGGAIALCTDLAARPGPAMRQMAKARSREAVVRRICKAPPRDALPAVRLAQTLEHHSVYLLSQLDPAAVEELDMIPIRGADELVRLAHRHPSCIVLANAPRAAVTVGG